MSGMRSLAAALLFLLACGGQSDDSDLTPDGGAGDGELPSCEPTPERCDGLGAERPGRLSEHSAAYDPERLELVVFGGTDTIPDACNFPQAEFLGETWVYDDVCNAWSFAEGQAPSPSGRHMSAWGDGRVWVFGGRFREPGEGGLYTLYDDLFRFDVEQRSWRIVDVEGERPAARVNAGLVWDSRRERLWLVGGNTSESGAAYEAVADAWSFDPETNSWEKHQLSGRLPPARLMHAVVYDELRDAIVMFGGADESAFELDAQYFADLWALDLEGLAWVELEGGGSAAPVGRFWAGMVHDPDADRYLLFGGHDAGSLGNRNDTWVFDPVDRGWQMLGEGDVWNAPANDFCDFPPDFSIVDESAPERRNAHSMVWSEACGHALIFGGKTDCGAVDDVWAFDGEAWEERMEATEGEVCLRWRDDPETCADMCF